MALISTTAPGMVQAANSMENTINQTNSSVATVSGSAATLRSSWQGDAGQSFNQAMVNWEQDSQNIVKALGSMVELLNGNRQTIVAGEQENTSVASQIPTGPGMAL